MVPSTSTCTDLFWPKVSHSKMIALSHLSARVPRIEKFWFQFACSDGSSWRCQRCV